MIWLTDTNDMTCTVLSTTPIPTPSTSNSPPPPADSRLKKSIALPGWWGPMVRQGLWVDHSWSDSGRTWKRWKNCSEWVPCTSGQDCGDTVNSCTCGLSCLASCVLAQSFFLSLSMFGRALPRQLHRRLEDRTESLADIAIAQQVHVSIPKSHRESVCLVHIKLCPWEFSVPACC